MPTPKPDGGNREHRLLADIQNLTKAAAAKAASEDAQLRQGELRPAATRFLDVAGLTALSRVLTPEQLATLIDRTFQLFQLDCERWGGALDKVIGDAALFVFTGSPDHPPPKEGALRAGLAILERMDTISGALADQGLDLAVRVGVAFGEVARQKVGGEDTALTVMGKTVNLAQRLEAAALPGALLTLPSCLEGMEGQFKTRSLGEMDLKGFGDTEVVRVLAARDAPRLRSGTARLTPLVGRDAEVERGLAAIHGWQETTHAGDLLDPIATGERVAKRGRLLVVSGPAAVGKSRLTWEIAQRLREEGTNIATAHALQSGGGLLAFTRELARLGGLGAEGLVKRFEALLTSARELLGEEYAERQRRHLPVLAFLLQSNEVDTSGIAQADPGSFALSARLALRSLCELVHHESGKPVVLVVEDLQWLADLEGLVGDLLASTALGIPLVVLGTARPEWEFSEGWVEACDHEEILLEPLSVPLAKALVEARLPGLTLPDDLWERVLDKADGVPYYLEEFANVLVDKEYAEAGDDGQWTLVRPPETVEVPDDVVALVLSRLDLLPKEQKELTGKAAVLGRAFLMELLSAIEEHLEDGRPLDLPGLLSHLADAGILHPDSDDEAPTPERYMFAHLLTRDAAYQSLLEHNRTILHRLAAKCLLNLYAHGTAGRVAALEQAAFHLKRGGQVVHALELLTECLREKANAGLFEGWEEKWLLCLEWLEDCPSGTSFAIPDDPPDATGWTPSAPWLEFVPRDGEAWLYGDRTRLAVFCAIAKCDSMWRCGAMVEAREAVNNVASHPIVATIAPERAYLLTVLGAICSTMGDEKEASGYQREALEIQKARDDKPKVAGLLNNLALSQRGQGKTQGAEGLFRQALDIWEEIGNPSGLGLTLGNLGVLLRQMGRLEEAEDALLRAVDLGRQTGSLLGEGNALLNLGSLHLNMDRKDQARETYRASVVLYRQISNVLGEAMGLANLGLLMMADGDLDGAAPLLETCQERFAELGDQRSLATSHIDLAVLARKRGDLDKARTHITQAAEHFKEVEDLLSLASALIEYGKIEVAGRNLAAAKEHASEIRRILQVMGVIQESNLSIRLTELEGRIEEFKEDP